MPDNVCEDARVTNQTEVPATRPRMEDLPGWELVKAGLADIAAQRETIAAELVRSASRRLAASGFAVPAEPTRESGSRLYELIVADVGEAPAHGRYNALRRRLASFLHAVGHAHNG